MREVTVQAISTSMSATSPISATTVLSTGSALGASVRSVQVPGAAKNRNCAGRRRRHLGGELAAAVEQPHVRARHRLAAAQDDALHDRLVGDVDALERGPPFLAAAHQDWSPSSIGTPTSEPHSVHEPS